MVLNGNLRGKRKFTVAVLALVMGFILALIGHMTGSDFVMLAGLVVGLYGGANAATAAVASKKNDD